eukprot:CAMPEP_0180532548 /NCGR_PEP_ID=MMETSP1036_2-20121128/63123_1 /TAXON_ID=632150 /ORGANISM="Azadinium spinosum, Strain 3D9" /LENGTH=40 /DNA_ID= /DNA_START= /DNA_END= /DNA_ORIENTATION=
MSREEKRSARRVHWNATVQGSTTSSGKFAGGSKMQCSWHE